jgi:hypothetical protein
MTYINISSIIIEQCTVPLLLVKFVIPLPTTYTQFNLIINSSLRVSSEFTDQSNID